ncbi:hypothetical protein [Halalkalibacter sp. APA_J-10(15)]|uniref:hypothetical protein n=1 Tax=Halalkalibacter sp. APA_J-10(15) TaxID=2933805 RepID=UPI001FF14322|nr:hypothetical protein [Halalkalibacter sp. APA_J-10(15)]MCK0470378.1 hypothetical protein [Halalkalibacter sp. APA_J-10(15)]
MKLIYKLLAISLLMIVITACAETDDMEGTTESFEMIGEGRENGWWGEWGEFYRVENADDLGEYQTGPLNVVIEEVQLLKGHFDANEYTSEETEYKYANFLMKMDLEGEIGDGIEFDHHYPKLRINEEEPLINMDELFSSALYSYNLRGASDTLISVSFELGDVSLEDIEKVTFIVHSPEYEGEPMSEDLEVDVSFE